MNENIKSASVKTAPGKKLRAQWSLYRHEAEPFIGFLRAFFDAFFKIRLYKVVVRFENFPYINYDDPKGKSKPLNFEKWGNILRKHKNTEKHYSPSIQIMCFVH